MKETNTHVSLYLNNSLNHSKLNELLPRRQQYDRAVFQAQSRKMSYHPCPGEVLSRNDAGQHIVGDGGVVIANSKFKEQKLSGIEKVQPRNLFALSQPRLTPSITKH